MVLSPLARVNSWKWLLPLPSRCKRLPPIYWEAEGRAQPCYLVQSFSASLSQFSVFFLLDKALFCC